MTTTKITDAAGEHQPPLPSQVAHDLDHLEYTPPRFTRRPQPQANNTRPYVRAYRKTWDAGTPAAKPGIALMHRHTIAAHLTPEEAYELANVLTDLAEQIDNKEQPDEW